MAPAKALIPALSRRTLARGILPLGAAAFLGLRGGPVAAAEGSYGSFPSQDEESVRATVRFAHFDLEEVRRLVSSRPALANAAVDWGFGDWETAVGAASHMGRRDIAEVLLAHGARPDLFTHAMLGHLSAVKGIVEAMPGQQRTLGPHGFTLLHHAKAGGEAAQAVVAYLEALGDADPPRPDEPLLAPQDAYLGTYRFGSGPGEDFEIVLSQGGLGLRRGEGFPRRLVHLGNNEFYPTGAAAVRVRFQLQGGQVKSASVVDGALHLEANRIAGPPPADPKP